MSKDYFSELINNLEKGNLTLRDIQIAYRTYIKKRQDMPEATKDILCGKEGTGGIIGDMFKIISEIEGAVYLSYMRGAVSNIEKDED